MIKHSLNAAKLQNQFDAALVANAWSAWNVVNAVAAQCHDIDNSLRRDTKHLLDLGGIENEVIFLRVEHLHARRDKLNNVLVAGDDKHFMAFIGGLAGQGTDDIVGLETFRFKNGNAKDFKSATDVGNLAAQIFRHRLALGLVAFVTN